MVRTRRAVQLAFSALEACCQTSCEAGLPSPSVTAAPQRLMHTLDCIRGSEQCSSSSQLCLPLLGLRAGPSNAQSQQALRSLPLSFNSHHRMLHASSSTGHGGGSEHDNEETISVVFVDKDGKEQEVRAPLGKNLLEVAHDNEVDLEGACEGSLACSTCHLIVEDEEYFKRMPEPCDDELDMLDLAFDLKETSRLGCQIIAAKDLDGLRVRMPSATRNFYVDGHKPKPH